MANIPETVGYSKALLDRLIGEWGLAAIIVVLGLGSFALGRLSALEEARQPVAVYEAPMVAAPHSIPLGGEFVASRTGSVYYYPWCSGAQKIGQGNQIWFATEPAAKAAGYSPAKNCKGLGSSQ